MNRLIVVLFILGVGLLVLLLTNEDQVLFGLDKDDLGRLLYLGTLVSIVGAGLLSSRRDISATVRGLAVWLAIILALMSGYQYRYELQDVASRLTAGLVPGSPLSVTGDDGRAVVMMEKRPNGHFEVRATVDGAPVHFLVDTGASSTVLNTADARRAGIEVGGLAFTIPVATANGTARAAMARVREIGVGDIVRRNQTVLIAAEGALDQSLLGMSFISTLSGFDMRGDRLTFRD